MSVAQKALARAKALKEGKSPSKPAAAAKKSAPAAAKKSTRTSTRGASEQEKSKVVAMFKANKPVSEISEAMGWVKKGNWPHYYTLGVIRQLRKAGKLGYHRAPEQKSKKSKK